MDRHELVYRVRQAAKSKLERRGIGLASPTAPVGASGNRWCSTFPSTLAAAKYQVAADKILAGKFDVFAMHDLALGFPPKWNQDPKTGTIAPLVFGKTLNYRDQRIVGDIKYLWEPNRHLPLVTLAQAWLMTGELKYAEGCQTLLDSWFEECPYPMGANWVSSIEHGVRLVNWSIAWHLLGGDDAPIFDGASGAEFRSRWLRSVFQHCHFIARHLSRHSSANNHLLGEYLGLLVAAITWPMWPESEQWRQTAAQGFEHEMLLQNGADGVNREQAIYYQHEVMDMMLLGGLVGRANGVEFSPEYWTRLELMMEFLSTVMDCSGNVQMIGDADDGLMVRFNPDADCSIYRSLMATGAVLFKRGDFAAKAGSFDDKSRWLLGDSAAEAFDVLVRPEKEVPRMAFADGGYYVMGTRFGKIDEIRAVTDFGPLGYLSIAAHGHADALSFLLSAGGHELLVDSGTFAYHTQEKWRRYFRGTFAHNTLRVDSVDQSEIGGNFLWLRKAQAHCTAAEIEGPSQRLSGWHDGYRALKDPVTHARTIVFNADENSFEIADELSCKGHHQVELCWHFAEDCLVNCLDGTVAATSGDVSLAMAMVDCNLSPTLFRGQEDPPAGWISRSFDVKTPTACVVWRGVIEGNTQLATRITINFGSRHSRGKR